MSGVLERRTLREQVVDSLRSEIAAGHLRAGTPLVETALSARFSVSRGTVREALRELHERGLVVHQPRTGTFVRQLNAEEITGVYEVRAALEGRAAMAIARSPRWAEHADRLEEFVDAMHRARAEPFVKRIGVDIEFHRELCRSSGNTTLVHSWELLVGQMDSVHSGMGESIVAPLMSTEDHLVIVDAIRSRDAGLIQRTIDRLMAHSAGQLLGSLKNPGLGTTSFADNRLPN
ncbi:GntR family transcriptional regulator [Streptomyces sp. KR55]|uniref:GntR family transcriptional regulator n=1 Tax=Streptomyces sp. KR55 TaxID=3457425 RepID=UPI003FD48695